MLTKNVSHYLSQWNVGTSFVILCKKLMRRFFQYCRTLSPAKSYIYCLQKFQKNQNGTVYGKAYMSASGIYWARGCNRDFEHWKASVFCFFETDLVSFGTELNNQSWSNGPNSYVIGWMWSMDLYNDSILWLSTSTVSFAAVTASTGTTFGNGLQTSGAEFPWSWFGVSAFLILGNGRSILLVSRASKFATPTLLEGVSAFLILSSGRSSLLVSRQSPTLFEQDPNWNPSSGSRCFRNGSRIRMAGPVSHKNTC